MSTATLLILATRVRDHGRAFGSVPGPYAERRVPLRQGRAGARLPILSRTRQVAGSAANAGARTTLSRVRVLAVDLMRSVLMLALPGLSASTAQAQAQEPQAPAHARVGGKLAPAPCVIVDIAGHKAGHLDCASQKLEAAARTAQAQARAAIDTPVIDATSPDVRTGVANQTATRQRMGNSFGISVQPQRPNRPPSVPRPGGRP